MAERAADIGEVLLEVVGITGLDDSGLRRQAAFREVCWRLTGGVSRGRWIVAQGDPTCVADLPLHKSHVS